MMKNEGKQGWLLKARLICKRLLYRGRYLLWVGSLINLPPIQGSAALEPGLPYSFPVQR